MDYLYSQPVRPGSYETEGLDVGILLRIHGDTTKEIKGALRAQRDWSKLVRPVHGYKGGLGDRFSFIRVTVPECLPERLEIISYSNEFAFIYDDAMEDFDLKDEKSIPADFLDTFGAKALEHKTDNGAAPEKMLQAQILAEMMAIDRQRALVTMKAWATFVQLASRTRAEPFDTLESYVPARVIDAGELIWFGTLTFGMALTIPDEEYDLCMNLARPGYAALGLANDLYSWPKERDAAHKAGQDYIFNAVWVIMEEQGVSEDEAKEICRDETRRYAEEYQRTVEESRGDMSLSEDVRKYLEAVLLSYIGNLVWSIYCPRYHEL